MAAIASTMSDGIERTFLPLSSVYSPLFLRLYSPGHITTGKEIIFVCQIGSVVKIQLSPKSKAGNFSTSAVPEKHAAAAEWRFLSAADAVRRLPAAAPAGAISQPRPKKRPALHPESGPLCVAMTA
jgi:hypothetical protein